MDKPIMDEEDAVAAGQHSGQQLYRMLEPSEELKHGDVGGDDGFPFTNVVKCKASDFKYRIFSPVSAATSESQWRDVDENTPRDGTHIIGKDADGNSHVVYRSPSSNCWLTAGAWHRVEITRWMPIPPDEESAEGKEWRAYCEWMADETVDRPDKNDLAWKAWKAAKGL